MPCCFESVSFGKGMIHLCSRALNEILWQSHWAKPLPAFQKTSWTALKKVLLKPKLLSQVGDEQYLKPWPVAKLRKSTKSLVLSGLQMEWHAFWENGHYELACSCYASLLIILLSWHPFFHIPPPIRLFHLCVASDHKYAQSTTRTVCICLSVRGITHRIPNSGCGPWLDWLKNDVCQSDNFCPWRSNSKHFRHISNKVIAQAEVLLF